MYQYVELGINEEVKKVHTFQRKLLDKDVKKVNGRALVRPLVEDPTKVNDDYGIYEMSAPIFDVQADKVVRRVQHKLKPNFKEILKSVIDSSANMARTIVLDKRGYASNGLQMLFIMDEEAQDYMADPSKYPEEFPFIAAGVGTVGKTPEDVAAQYRASFTELKRDLAEIEREKLRIFAAMDETDVPDAVIRAFDSRSEILKQN